MSSRRRPSATPRFGRGLRRSSGPANSHIADAGSAGPGRPTGWRGRALPWTGAAVLSVIVVTLTSPASAGEILAQGCPVISRSAAVDQWSGLLAETAVRTGLPAVWLHDLMRAESNGKALAVSPKGAIGLMQLMPATYAMLRIPLGLGADPFAPRDNILAGATYLRLLADRYGWPGALVAYNAGPGRLDAYLTHGRALPSETIAYVWKAASTRAASLADSGLATSPTALVVASKAQPNASVATLHETMFVPVASTPSTAQASTAEAVTSRGTAAPSWRESSLFAPISSLQTSR